MTTKKEDPKLMEKIDRFFRKYGIVLLLSGLFVLLFILSYLSEGTYGGSDDYGHYKFARYAFSHPELYLEHWAKPFFTLLASPFAQFGFLGVKLFNLICGLLAGYFAYRICRMLKYRFSWLVVVMICFAPVYLSMLLSGMTEILFSLVLVFTVFLALRKNFLWSAIVLSFLPFVRNEGIVIFPLFFLYYCIHKKYKVLPFLLTGFIVYSLAGFYHYRDILWVITKMPYTGAKDIYGSGSLFHFVTARKDISGVPLAIFWLIGLVPFFYQLFKQKFSLKEISNLQTTDELLLIIGPFVAYFVAHSVLWWKGWGGSLGLIRVIAGVIPLFAIIGVKGIAWLSSNFSRKQWLSVLLVVVVLYFLVVTPFKVLQIPVQLGPAESLIKKASNWVHESGLDKNRVYYYDPYYWFGQDIDPYDQNKVWEVVPDKQIPSHNIPEHSVIFWDSHYGPNEGKLQLERLMNDSFLTLKKVYRPLQPFSTLGGYNYEICIFQKTGIPNDLNLKWHNYEKADSLNEISMKTVYSCDFEIENELYKSFHRTDSVTFSGKYSCLIAENEEFSPTITLPFRDLKYNSIYRVSVMVKGGINLNWKSVFLVASASNNEKLYLYSTQCPVNEKGKGWRQAEFSFELPKPKTPDDILKVYVWNKDRQRFYMDDLIISH